ncbi:MAG: ATPase, T2SS/T4P/T4SS family [Deinococcota bacterium]
MTVLSIGDKRLGAVLLDSGYISDENLQRAIGRHGEVGGRLADILVSLGVISEQRIARAIEETIGIPTVNLPRTEIMGDAIAKVPADLAQEIGAIPFKLEDDVLRVAFSDPLDALSIEEIEDESDCMVEPYKALSNEIQWALATFYPELGLAPPQEITVDVSKRLGNLAFKRGLITQAQFDEALLQQQQTGILLGRALIEKGIINEAQLSELLAEQAGIPFVNTLDSVNDNDIEKLTGTLLRIDAVQYEAVPYQFKSGNVVVALADPNRMRDIEAIVNRPLEFVCAPPDQVKARIDELYDESSQIGETLLQSKKLKREQLREAIQKQSELGRATSLSDVLIEMGVSESDIQDAKNKQRSGGGKLEDTLVQSGKISPDMLARSLARQLGYEYIENDKIQIDPLAVALIPETTVRRYDIMPIRLEGNNIVLAMKDPRNVFALDDIKILTGKEVIPMVISGPTLGALTDRFYASNVDMDELSKELVDQVGGAEVEERDTSAIDDNALVRVVNNIIRESALNDISDIHIEPRPGDVLVRVRKDGALREYMTLPKETGSALSARIKIMGGLDIAEKRKPQDGRVRFRDKSMMLDLRLSTLPTVYGEKSVMRILKKADSIPEIEKLGIADYNFQKFSDIIEKPYGIFLITGPTGSGKSFTTFSMLKRIARPEVNVTTVEDPVEYEVPGINQTQVNVKAGLTFASALRSFLRQDPDIIMVGEIRDQETAQISVEAALTGHLVIATLHTNDAPGAVTRLEEMGLEPFNIGASLIGVIAQRLVRRVCKNCKVEYTPSPDVLRRIGVDPSEIEGKTLYKGVGCEECNGTGYNGRAGIHELFIVDDDVRNAIVRGSSSTEIKDIAVTQRTPPKQH